MAYRSLPSLVGLVAQLLLLSLGSIAPATARAQPSDALEVIVPWGPGGGADQLGRVVARLLQNRTNAVVDVVNVPGKTGNLGMHKLLQAPSDGRSLIVLTAETFCLQAYHNPGWVPDDVIPLAIMMRQPSALFVASNSRFADWKAIENEARRKPKALRVAISGAGSPDFMLLQTLAAKGMHLVPVPYERPEQRYQAVLDGKADLLYEQPGDVKALTERRQLRPVLAVSAERMPFFKDTPTTAELGYGEGPAQFRAIAVKAGTDPARVKQLAETLNEIATASEFKAFLAEQLAIEASHIPAKMAPAFLRRELEAMRRTFAALSTHAQYLWDGTQEAEQYTQPEGAVQ